MRLRTYALSFFVGSILFSCNKSEKPDDTINSADTLHQYLEYIINDSLVRLNENDTITFNPGYSAIVRGSNVDFIYSNNLTVSVEYKNGTQSTFKHKDFSFILKRPYNQMNWTHEDDNSFDPVLYQDVFESLFQTGEMDYLPQHCYDSITDKASIGIMFPFYDDFQNIYKSYGGCLNEFEENKYKQDSSFFRINKISDYRHKKFGDCKLLEGEFKVILYYAPGAPWEERLMIRDGRYKFVVTNNRWR